jgi:OmpA family
MQSHLLKTVCRAAVLAAMVAVPVALTAQSAPKPTYSYGDAPSRGDLFLGYSYLSPHDTVETLQQNGTTLPFTYKANTWGLLGSGAYYFNKNVGLQAEIGAHDLWINSKNSNSGFLTTSGGIIFRFPTSEVTPFIHGLVGGVRGGGPDHQPYTWGTALTAGGGMDIETPALNHHLAIRLFQADYEYMHLNWGPGVNGGRANIDAARLSAGLVFHVGSIKPPDQLTVACAVNPTSVFPGDPVTATATPGMADPKLNVLTSITGDGVGAASGATATVNTASLAPGQHTVTCNAKEGKPGKEGVKPWQIAAPTTATFTVKAFEPPTASCSANPSTIKPGDSSNINATGMSPQNRPLTYTYSASSGTINGSGASATYSSTGAPTGPVSITCTVTDDKGQTASGNTTVTIEAPEVMKPKASALCSITFSRDTKRPGRVDNEAKACLDEVALTLQRQSDSKAIVVGESSSAEKAPAKGKKKAKPVADLAAQRAVNTKDYLVSEKGIDPSRISVATRPTDSQQVENYLVPSGADASTDVTETTPVDESMVKPQKRTPLPERHAAKAKKAKM